MSRKAFKKRRGSKYRVSLHKPRGGLSPRVQAVGPEHFGIVSVHPFATKQFCQPADPGNKTDETDLAAIARATINGFGLLFVAARYGSAAAIEAAGERGLP